MFIIYLLICSALHAQEHGSKYIVSFKDDENWKSNANKVIEKYGINAASVTWFDFINAAVLTLKPNQATEVASMDFVVAVEKDS